MGCWCGCCLLRKGFLRWGWQPCWCLGRLFALFRLGFCVAGSLLHGGSLWLSGGLPVIGVVLHSRTCVYIVMFCCGL